MPHFSAVLIGEESLLIGCAEQLLDQGHGVAAVVSKDASLRDWAVAKGLPAFSAPAELETRFQPGGFDWLLSVANLTVIPDAVLALAGKGAVNFHDGPLPAYAGLNTPVWALLNGESRHGVTWHLIAGGIDEGNILVARQFDIAPDETAHSLNSKCYGAALDSFPEVIAKLASGDTEGAAQDLSGRTYFGGRKRPQAAGTIDLAKPAEEIGALVRGLDFGSYWNPLACAKLRLGARIVLVGSAQVADVASAAAPGTVLTNNGMDLTVATGSAPLVLGGLRDSFGRDLDVARLIEPGEVIAPLSDSEKAAIEADLAKSVRFEAFWRGRLADVAPAKLPLATATEAPQWERVVVDLPALPREAAMTLAGLLAAQSCGPEAADLAFAPAAPSPLFNAWVPLRYGAATDAATLNELSNALGAALAEAAEKAPFARDLVARAPELSPLATPDFGLTEADAPVQGTAVTLSLANGGVALFCDAARLDPRARDLLAERLRALGARLAEGDTARSLGEALALPASERALLESWNQTARDFNAGEPVHAAFEAQVRATPEATALVFENQALSYAELNRRANRVAHELVALGAKPGVTVGIFTERSLDLMIGALGILKSGAAYVPLDPDYPADRIAHYIADSGAPIIVTQPALTGKLPPHSARVLELDGQAGAGVETDPESGVTGADLAYLIYTSGSTGTPKGVMVEHRNVANFFTGMDEIVDREKGTAWLAITSLSFDISVFELFYTLARGFKVVLSGGDTKAAVSNGKIMVSDRHIDFGLMYWGNDDGQGPKKYALLLDGAKFADANGFNAVWTPERHFHAFGGPFPNPSVTGAAVAAVTQNISVRSGSCVAPLHHPARIAEEWAVIDNLTNGRAGIGFASGWQPDDFVLRPENTPPKNKPAMYESIDKVRRLWRGESVDFPTESGEMFGVVTQPRPVSKELAVWVTTAGNPETWREAGEMGANVLTHLLGQSIEEVGEKIKIYHAALQAAGFDPNDFKVTVMLHTFLAETREDSARIARGPMKDYLRSAAGLIKQYAWAFPAFKRPKGVNNPFEMDMRDLSSDDVEAILDFAFERYFEESGMFGTIEDGVARAEQLKRFGVDEIACLIDYGIPAETVLEGLKPLAEVLKRANAPTRLEDDDFSVAAQIIRHGVTHLQCTPSMARIFAMNDEARVALSHVQQLFIGGEALPGDLVEDLRGCTNAAIHNMYGPTETTIWSTHRAVTDTPAATVSIGTPIANTAVHVLDGAGRQVPVGLPGELCIAGDGVTRGYWQRDEMTEERFPDDPFAAGRMYRTGDMVRWNADGTLGFLGRSDTQVKIRGQRIELGEIEARIAAFPGVRQAAAVAREDTPGDVRLVAYITVSQPVAQADLQADLARHLPDVMVPAQVVTLERFPLTPNRKIDRQALPAPLADSARPAPLAAAAPGSETEKAIAGVWARVLGVSHVAASDNFFALGGHSLLAVQAHREIRQVLGTDALSITDVFRFPVLSDLARHLTPDQPAQAAASPEDQAQKTATMSKRRAMRANRMEKAG